MLNLDLIIMFSALLGLVGIFVGLILAGKFAGKLKGAAISLTIAIIIFTAEAIFNVLNVLEVIDLMNTVFWNGLFDLGIILFLLLTLYNMFSMARGIKHR
jgi:hypothetical protein